MKSAACVTFLDELETYLDPLFGEHLVQTDRVKQSIVLSQEDRIERDLALLDQVRVRKSIVLSQGEG